MNTRISAIIPAYNEASTIANVLRVVTSFPDFAEVIVVDDGSTDNTANIVSQYPVRYIRHTTNQGKGQAMETGARVATGSILFFCDADIHGLNHDMLYRLLHPVIAHKADMSVGLQNIGQYVRSFLFPTWTILSGLRVVRRTLWQHIPLYYKQHFRIEMGLNYFARHNSRGIAYIVTVGLTHAIKEKKYGLEEGLRRRYAMMLDIIATMWKLHITWRSQ